MNEESPWIKNPLLNGGILVLCVGILTLTYLGGARLLGIVIAIIGFIMFFVGYLKAKASGALLPSVNERRRKMRVIMICLPFIVLVWLIIKWPRISKLRGEDIWIFAIVGLVTILGLLGLYFWLDKKLAKRSESEAEDTQNDGIPSAAKPVLKQPGNRPQLPRKSRDD